MKLSNLQIQRACARDRQYKLADEDGLFLLVTPNGRKYWRFEYSYGGKRNTHAIGVYPRVSLKSAREKHRKALQLLDRGLDPNAQKKLAKLRAYQIQDNSFRSIALAWHRAQSVRWSQQHANRVKRQLEQRAFPFIGNMLIDDIDSQIILSILRAMQAEGVGEATFKLKQRLRSIFTFAIAEGRIRNNPAVGLEAALAPKPREKNNPYLLENDLAKFLVSLDKYDGLEITKLGLQLIVHTFLRSNELRGAKWQEIDFANREWVIPAERMKCHTAHLVPLSDQVFELLQRVRLIESTSEYLFPSRQSIHRPFSQNTLLFAIYRMGYKGQTTVHGFRASASTILNENGFNPDVIERQLSHVEQNKIRAAYNHAQFKDQRREMMQWYSQYLDELTSNSSASRITNTCLRGGQAYE